MREVKFRGLGIKDNKWHYGNLVTCFDHTKKLEQDKIICFINEINSNNDYKVYPDSVGQYIELKGKCDIEIYEGDIIKRKSYTDYDNFCNVDKIFGVVNYLDCEYVIEQNDFIWELSKEIEFGDATQLEVIGNIYENKELLMTK